MHTSASSSNDVLMADAAIAAWIDRTLYKLGHDIMIWDGQIIYILVYDNDMGWSDYSY